MCVCVCVCVSLNELRAAYHPSRDYKTRRQTACRSVAVTGILNIRVGLSSASCEHGVVSTGLHVSEDHIFDAVSTTYSLLYISLSHSFGPYSSVGIATDYGLDGLGTEPRWDVIFRPSRPALGPTKPPLQWVPGLSRR